MRLKFADVIADAVAMWRSEKALLIPIASVFFLVPWLAFKLFLPQPDITALADEAAKSAAVDAWTAVALPWLFGVLLAQTYGTAVLLLMLLDRARPTVRTAMGRALRLLPGLLAAQLLVGVGVGLGIIALILPGLYLLGRTLITSPLYLIEPERGAIAAVLKGFERTRNNGVLLAMLWSIAFGASYLFEGLCVGLARAAVAIDHLLVFPVTLVSAAGSAAAVLALVLLQAAAYRALSAPSTGT